MGFAQMNLEITPATEHSRPAGQLPIVPVNKSRREPDLDAHILAMFLLWAKAPRTPDPDADGMYDLSEIGSAPEKNWSKATPYSLARRAK
jgi:hypothetical protein